MISYPEIYHNFLKFKIATMCMYTRKTAKDRNLHNIHVDTFLQVRSTK